MMKALDCVSDYQQEPACEDPLAEPHPRLPKDVAILDFWDPYSEF